MIFDSAKNLDFYRGLGIEGRYNKAVDFLQNTDLENLAPGKYEIDGKNVYANVTEYTTIPWEEAKYESHHDYTDIQYMITGTETMTYAPVDALNVTVPYNEEKDCVLYDLSLIHILKKCGMKYEGTMRQADINNQGICDFSEYGILAEDYFGGKQAEK